MINRRIFLGGVMSFAAPRAIAAKRAVETVDFGPAELDIHNPAPGQRLPVLLYIHGGAWQVGSRRDVGAKPEFFRALGFLFVSADYRLGPFHRPDRQAQDVVSAFGWVRANIAGHGGDPSRIIVMGHSAGCHLAALAALRGDLPGVAGLILNDIQMYDIDKYAEARGSLPRHFAYLFPQEKWTDLSPVTHLGKAPVPPVLIAWSKMPHSRDLSLDFASKLKGAGANVTVFDGLAYKHVGIDRKIGMENDAMSGAITKYLQQFR
ncbi:MAG: alpha/beta hydrolase [Rhizobiaceae bacterium]